jgi:uncharacterized cupredoxin-like copper-binding protein
MRHIREHRRLAIGLVIPLVVLAACGGDDSDETADAAVETPASTTAAPSPPPATSPATSPGTAAPSAGSIDPALEEFCALAAELNDQDGPPTVEQLRAYADLAPDEIAADVTTFVEVFEAADGDFTVVFTDPAAGAAAESLTAFEAEQCGFESDEPEQDPSVTVLDPDATRVDLTATDYHFDGDIPSEAGRYSFVMTNEGDEVHILILVHLEDDATIDEVMASEGEVGVVEVFESDVAPPGSEAVVTADLAPGRWMIVCPIPNPAGTPHLELGMLHEFTIT